MKISIISLLFAMTSASLSGGVWKGSGNQSNFNRVQSWNNNVGPGPGVTATFVATPSDTAQPIVTSNITTDLLFLEGNSQISLTATDGILSLQTGLTVQSGSSLDFTGTLNKAGSGPLNFIVDGASSFAGTINNSGNSVNLTGSGVTTLLDTTLNGSLAVAAASTLEGRGTVTGSFTLNGNLSPGGNGSGTISVGGAMGGSGTWVFDAVDSSTRDLITVAGSLDVSGFDLNLSGARSTANGPIVIATYGGSVAGPFSSVNGLLPGQSISYTGGQIALTGAAIIPEVTNIIPLSLAFLPLVAMRKRRSRV